MLDGEGSAGCVVGDAGHHHADGTGWAVLADPEGNEFCVERSVAERSAPAGAA